MAGYIRSMWVCRYFWLSLVRMDLRARYKGSAMGIGWSLLHPLAMTTILSVVFCKIFNQTLDFFAPFVMVGLTFWGFITSAVSQGCTSFFAGESYIRQYPAPMAIYPLRTVLGAMFHFVIALVLVVGMAIMFRGVNSPLALLSLVPTLLLLLLLGWALATLFGLFNVCFRDTQHLSEVGLQAMFYLTPIIYPLDMFKGMGRGRMLILFQFNPLVSFLDLLREPILYGRVPELASYGTACTMVALLLGGAALLLHSQERRLIFYL